MSNCAGAGREHQQAASPSCPKEIFHATGIMLSLQMGIDSEAGILFFFSISNSLWSMSSNFDRNLVFLENFTNNSLKFTNSRFHNHLSGTDCESGIRQWENCIAYSLFCIFITIISSSRVVLVFILVYLVVLISTYLFTNLYYLLNIHSSINICFVVLNCLYLKPQVSPFVHFCSHPAGREGEGWASSCLVLSCQLPG